MLRLPNFQYHLPSSIDEAVAIKAEYGMEAMYVSGGTDLLPKMKRRQQEPGHVIQLAHLAGLGGVTRTADGGLRIGAAETLGTLERHGELCADYPALANAIKSIATPLIRNSATIGGNLTVDTRCFYYDQTYEWRKGIDFCMKKDGDICRVAKSSPTCLAVSSSDTAPVAVALGAGIELHGPGGARTVPAASFYNNDGIDYIRKSADELVTGLRLPSPGGWVAAYEKVRRRGSIDFSVLSVAVWIKSTGPKLLVEDARVVIGGVSSAPMIIPEAADALRGPGVSEETISAAAAAAHKATKPMYNTDLPITWRRDMVQPFVARALRKACE